MARDKHFFCLVFLCLENVLCTWLCYSDAFFVVVFCCCFKRYGKNGRVRFGGIFPTLIYLNHYSKMDICRSCLIAFMFEFLPPHLCLILCHDWINLHRFCVYFGNNSTSKKKKKLSSMLPILMLENLFLLWAEKWERNMTYVI